jgi:hypothetical protein
LKSIGRSSGNSRTASTFSSWNRLEGGTLAARLARRQLRTLVRDLWPFAWSADGEWIYAHNEKRDVFRVSATSGKSETVASFPTGTLEAGCDVTPDRKTLICAVQEQHSDAWLAEHFAR